MAVKVNEMNPETKAFEVANQQENESEFASKLVESMDLPASLASNIEESHKKELEDKPEEEVSDEEAESEESAEVSEEGVEKNSEESTEGSEEEDLIPRSKVQKRFDEQTRQIKQLQSEIRRLGETSKQVPADDTTKRLEQMSQEELTTLKRQVRIAQVKNASDDAQLNQLLDLEEKIGQVERNAPQRFVQQQVGQFEEAVRESSNSIENFDKVKGAIFNTAKEIFTKYPDLQRSVTGQRQAWEMAVDQYEILSKHTAGKSKVNELERQMNTLKKKVSVESSTSKVSKPSDSNEKLFKKAKYGTAQDKENYFHKILNTDSYIPDEQLNR